MQVHTSRAFIERAIQVGLDCGITAYDVTYVAPAESLSAPLITADIRLFNSLQGTAFAHRVTRLS